MTDLSRDKQIQEFYDAQCSCCKTIASALIKIRNRWTVERGIISFSEYVPVIKFHLRAASMAVQDTTVHYSGNKIVIHVKFPHRIRKNAREGVVFTIESGGISVVLRTTTTVTLEEQLENYSKSYAKYCERHGLTLKDFNAVFTMNDKEYKVVGAKSRKQKFGVICLRLKDNQLVNVRAEAVLERLRAND